MKKIITLLLSCTSLLLSAQKEKSTISVENNLPNWNQLLSKLDTTAIKSGVVYNRVVPFANLTFFNLTKENNIANYDLYLQALSELYRASNKKKFTSVDNYKKRLAEIRASSPSNNVNIGLINTDVDFLIYDKNNPEASNVNYSQEEGAYLPKLGKNSFTSRKIVLAAPLKNTVETGEIIFKFDTDLWFNNETSPILGLQVSFDNGVSYKTIIENGTLIESEIRVNYEPGYHYLKFNFSFSEQAVLSTFAEVNVINAPSTTDLCTDLIREKGTFTSPVSFQGYAESEPVFGKIEYTTFYASNNTAKKMLNPLIIVDGFDPGDTRKVQDCDCENDPICRGLEKYIDCHIDFDPYPHRNCVFNREKHKSIEDQMVYNISSTQTKNLLKELRDMSFDVTIINNPTYTYNGKTIDGGADYIERNAITLANFMKNYIKTRQQTDGSNAGTVLIGPSMGGQITRYALAYMEKKYLETGLEEWKHNTKLWVSVDSPHLGASIPVGTQANIWFLGYPVGKQSAKDLFESNLLSPAARQMTIQQFQNALDTGNDYGNGGYLNDSAFYTQYYSNLNNNGVSGSNGYPVSVSGQFRKIAMINGSLTGAKTGVEGAKYLDIFGYMDVNLIALAAGYYACGPYCAVLSAMFLTSFFNNIFGNSVNLKVELLRAKDWYQPLKYTSGLVYSGDAINSGNFSHPGLDFYVNNNDIRGCIDVVPAGTFNSTKDLKDGIIEGLNSNFAATEVRAFLGNHSFIPSFSSLGHLYPNQDWSKSLAYNLTCPTAKETPFDSYFGQSFNSEHISFSKEGVDWLKKELQGIPQLPNFPVDPNALQGPDRICLYTPQTPNTYTYTFDPCSVPGPVDNWTAQYGIQIVSHTLYSVTVKGLSNGYGNIFARFSNGIRCTKKVYVGVPQFQNFNYRCGASLCYDDTSLSTFNFTSPINLNSKNQIVANFTNMILSESNSNNNWQWEEINPNGTNLLFLSGTLNRRTICALGAGTTTLRVKVKNGCDWSEWASIDITIVQLPNSIINKQSPAPATLSLKAETTNALVGTQNPEYCWTNENIWVRNTQDGLTEHQNPIYNENAPNYLYARIANTGCATSNVRYLRTYWGKAATSLNWPNSWNGSKYNNGDALLGDAIGTATIPEIDPEQETIVSMPFQVPNPEKYKNIIDEPWRFGFLATINEDVDSTLTNSAEEFIPILMNKEDIALKNVTVVDLTSDNPEEQTIGGVIAIGNPFDESKSFYLQLVKEDLETGKPIYQEAEVSMKLDEELYQAWLIGGKKAERTDNTLDEKMVLAKDNNVLLKDIALDAYRSVNMYLKFNFLTKEITDKSRYVYHVIQRETGTNNIVGGQTFVIKKDQKPLFAADAGDTKYVDKNEPITITADQIADADVYNWYDESGNLIASSRDISISTEVGKKLKLEVIRKDGFKDYTQVEVELNPNSLGAIAPNPATDDKVNIAYRINKAQSAYLMVLGSYGTIGASNNYILDLDKKEMNLDVSNYPVGFYIIALVCDGQIVDAKTLSKQ